MINLSTTEILAFSLQVSAVVQYTCPEPTDDDEESVDAANPSMTNACQARVKVARRVTPLTISQTKMR